jgi:alginate O-acetyltransferase complex protein AlgJ
MNKQETREAQARREVGQTDISSALARLLVVAFLVIIFGLPIAHQVAASRAAEQGALAGGPATRRESKEGVISRIFSANTALLKRINLYQEHLDDTFILSRKLRSPVQAFMVRLGVGNEKVFVGCDDWLFYEPGMRYLTGPGFLFPRQLKRRAREGIASASTPQPDPVKAIVHFRDQLKQRGVELIVMPVPTKATVHPDKFVRGVQLRNVLLLNTSYVDLLDQLQERGVHVFECLPLITDAKFMSGPRYLKTDSHWVPMAVSRIAESLAESIGHLKLDREATSQGAQYERHATRVTNMGDLAFMLDQTEDFIQPESVDLATVMEPGGTPWRNRSDADVLLLGDSFANIYSLADMGWGEGAGLAEQLSFALQHPVERIVRNDAGAYATREMLARDLARGRDRLTGKKLVIWQFAARELAFGDWKLIDLPEVGELRSGGSLSASRVTGRIAQLSERPVTDAVYKTFIMKFFITDLAIEDGQSQGDGVVHMLAMKNREFLPPAGLRLGAKISLSLRPWSEVEERYGSLKMGSLDDIMLEIEKPLYWGELK